eukprot:SM012567S26278  [mRNA]  locus=s12567:280:327:- [translate_table: standard]
MAPGLGASGLLGLRV